MPKAQNTILIIDDSESQRKAIVGLLELRGYACIETAEGDDVESILNKHSNVLRACALDLTLRDNRRSGLETLRAIRRMRPILPVLVFTGQDEVHAKDAVIAGATLFMRKPYQTQDLIAAIDSLVLMHSLRESVLATEGEIDMLQAALDAMKVEVSICNSHGEMELENAARKQWTEGLERRPPSLPEQGGVWIESQEGERWVWSHEASAVSKSGRKFLVRTAIDVTKRKMIDEIRQELWNRATKSSREELVEYVADWLHDKFGYSRVRVYLVTDKTMLGCTARGMESGFVMKGYPFPSHDPQAARALREKRPFLLLSTDFQDDPCFKEFQKKGVETQIQIPLVSAAGPVGLISADDKGSRKHLNIEDVELMSFLSPLIADAIQVSDEIRERQRREEWAEALNEIDRPLTDGSGLSEVFQTMGRTLAKLVHADAGVVFIRRSESEVLRVVTVIDGNDQELWKVTHAGTTGMIKKCLDADGLVFERDIWKVPEFVACFGKLDSEPWKKFLQKAKSVVIEPIRCGERVIGVLFLRCPEAISLNEIDERYLYGVAKRVSIALAKLDESQRIEAALIQQAKLHDLALLSAGVAHGMRNPLATIQSSLDKVRRQCELANEPLERTALLGVIQEIETATQRSLKTLERLIDWAKPHGQDRQWMSLGTMTEDLVAMIRDDLEFRKIEVVTSIDPSLPMVFASPDPLRMALSDLFWNATKAMPDGGRLEVTLQPSADQQQIELVVADNGVGMSPSQLDSLFAFNPFEPLPAGGSGLGLYLCRKVLAADGAELRAHSFEGLGTTMTAVFSLKVQLERMDAR